MSQYRATGISKFYDITLAGPALWYNIAVKWPLPGEGKVLEAGFSNPQPNPQIAMSCTTCKYIGSPRGLVSCCKTNKRYSDKGEVGGSSPPRPTIQITNIYAAILTFPFLGTCHQKTVLPKICQKLSRP